MARADLDVHGFASSTLATARAAFDLAMADLEPEIHLANCVAIEREVAAAVADLVNSGQLNVDRLRVYATSRGWLAANMRARA